MPWTRQAVKFLLSKGSPLTREQRSKMVGELHRDPGMGHARKGSSTLQWMAGAKKRKQPS